MTCLVQSDTISPIQLRKDYKAPPSASTTSIINAVPRFKTGVPKVVRTDGFVDVSRTIHCD